TAIINETVHALPGVATIPREHFISALTIQRHSNATLSRQLEHTILGVDASAAKRLSLCNNHCIKIALEVTRTNRHLMRYGSNMSINSIDPCLFAHITARCNIAKRMDR